MEKRQQRGLFTVPGLLLAFCSDICKGSSSRSSSCRLLAQQQQLAVLQQLMLKLDVHVQAYCASAGCHLQQLLHTCWCTASYSGSQHLAAAWTNGICARNWQIRMQLLCRSACTLMYVHSPAAAVCCPVPNIAHTTCYNKTSSLHHHPLLLLLLQPLPARRGHRYMFFPALSPDSVDNRITAFE